MKRAVTFAIILIGFTAMASQVVLAREFLNIFCGNELSIGFILAAWLIGGAIGSSLLGRFADRIKRKIAAFSLCQLVLSIILPLSVLAIRSVHIALNAETGEVLGLFPMAASSFVILAPICVILGFMFTLGCRIYAPDDRPGAVMIGNVYVLEAAGAMIGGLTASFVLISLLDSVYIAAILSFLNLSAAFFLQYFSSGAKSKRFLMAFAAAALIAITAMWPLKGWDTVRRYSLAKQWKGFDLIASENSIYGNIAVAKKEGQISFFDNGLRLYTVPDAQAAEEAVHFALLEHPDPKDVLLVGGGVGGLVEEVIKHPVRKCDYVELDPLIIEMGRRYLPDERINPLEDPRVSIRNEDGRFFVKTTGGRYDCVIVRVGDPQTAQLNRYYTAEFFKEVKRILRKGGIVSFGVTSSENYINPELKAFLASIYRTLKQVFTGVIVIPGDTAYFVASDKPDELTYDYNVLMERAKARRLDLKYVREYYLSSRLSPQRVSYIEEAVNPVRDTSFPIVSNGINHDFRPITYYYDTIFWTTYFRDSLFNKILKSASESAIWKIAFFACVFIVLLNRSFKRAALTAVAAAGFTGMAFQVLVLLSFQVIYGYLYYRLGLILTSFMIGLAAGGVAAVKMIPALKKERPLFIWTQGAILAYPLALPILCLRQGPEVCFIVLPILAGFIGGFQFPLASRILLAGEEGPPERPSVEPESFGRAGIGKTAGLTYGVDLAGSCLGALLTGVFLIPLLGIPKTCLLLAALNLSVILALLISKSGRE